jgi:hypothetical protein
LLEQIKALQFHVRHIRKNIQSSVSEGSWSICIGAVHDRKRGASVSNATLSIPSSITKSLCELIKDDPRFKDMFFSSVQINKNIQKGFLALKAQIQIQMVIHFHHGN